jgi:hypothetical protein
LAHKNQLSKTEGQMDTMAMADFAYAYPFAITEQTQPATPSGAPGDKPVVAPTLSAMLHIPEKTVVVIAVGDPISSKTSKIGDTFALTLAEPLIIDGQTVLPAGLSGHGEVTHAAKSGWGGKSGELIVNARYLECGDLRIPLGHFHYVSTGKSNLAGAFATAQIIPLGQFMVPGGEALVPAGTRGTAQVNADVPLPAGAITRCDKSVR